MKLSKYDYSVIGGDLRQVYLAEELSHSSQVICYALANVPDKCISASSLEDAIHLANCVICPIPFSKDGLYLNQNSLTNPLTLDSVLNLLESGHTFFAGCIPDDFRITATEKGVFTYDLMKNNSLAIYNTLATAEGAICEAIQKSPQNLHHSKCAILGYGKCGRTLASYLNGMFCDVYVFSIDTDELAWADTFANRALELSALADYADEFDFVFNTIPVKVLTDEILSKMHSKVTIIDIASYPGGVDYASARKRNINAFLCLGLPGKYSPYSCAKAIKNVIESNIKE